jgi:hypothetical protein
VTPVINDQGHEVAHVQIMLNDINYIPHHKQYMTQENPVMGTIFRGRTQQRAITFDCYDGESTEDAEIADAQLDAESDDDVENIGAMGEISAPWLPSDGSTSGGRLLEALRLECSGNGGFLSHDEHGCAAIILTRCENSYSQDGIPLEQQWHPGDTFEHMAESIMLDEYRHCSEWCTFEMHG